MESNSAKRVGWMVAEDVPFDGAVPSPEGYSLSILGPLTIRAMIDHCWIEDGRGKIIYNTGYNMQYDANIYGMNFNNCKIVNWCDSVDVVDFSRAFLNIRNEISVALTGSPRGGVLVDSTSVSKSVQAAVLGLLLRTKSVKFIDFIYQKIEYKFNGLTLSKVFATDVVRHKINDISFSVMGVPYVEGKYHSERRRHIILIVGLDYQRILYKIRELEPASIDVIIEKEAIIEKDSESHFKMLCNRLDVRPSNIVVLPRMDFLQQIEALRSAVNRAKNNFLQPIVVAAGGKPATIAAALQSVSESEVPLLTSVPDRVVPLSQEPNSAFQVFRLTDPTSIG